MTAAIVGWTICALFASVAFNWTFYYVLALAVAGREIVASRRQAAAEAAPTTAPRRGWSERTHDLLRLRASRAMKRRILIDARTPVHYTMFAPVHDAMAGDERVRFYFCASEEPSTAASIFRDAGPNARLIGPAAAALLKFDAYLTSDFTWTRLLHRTCRIQMFHGVGGKYGFDAPTESLSAWHRLFFVNRRRLNNCIASGALDGRQPGDPPDRHAEGGRPRRRFARAATRCWRSLGLPPDRPTVLYAPTWSPASSLNTLGVALVQRLRALPVNVIVKLHDRSLRSAAPVLGRHRLARDARAAPRRWIGRARDRGRHLPVSRGVGRDDDRSQLRRLRVPAARPAARPDPRAGADRAREHPQGLRALLADASDSTSGVDDTVVAVERALADPRARSATRRAVAADLFHEPGTATARCAEALYEAIELEPKRIGRRASQARLAKREAEGGRAAQAGLKACATQDA